MSYTPEELKDLIEGEVLNDDKTLEHYGTDYSLFRVRPNIVVFPKNRSDIKKLVLFAAKNNTSVTARGAGTDMSGGPLNEGIVMDLTKYINNIIEIGNDFGISEPGTLYRDFEKETLKHGLLFPSYPASKGLASVGGIVANNSGGEKSLIYGKTEKWVEEIKMILRDGKEYAFKKLEKHELNEKMKQTSIEGEIYRDMYVLIKDNYDEIIAAKPKVSKNSAGYYLWNVYNKETHTFDLTKLIVGSQGTLGIITEVKLKLIKPKPSNALLVLFVNDISILGNLVTKVLSHKPESFESYDDKTFNIALQFLPDMAKSLGASGLISLGWRFLPEFWMAVTGGVPKLVLVAEFTGDTEEEVYAKARMAEVDLKDFPIKMHIAKDDKEEAKYWTVRRQSFKLLTDHSKGKRTEPFIDDIVVSPEKLPDFLPKLYAILEPYHLNLTVAGHIGDGNFHIIPLGTIGDANMKTIIPELEKKVYELVISYGGSITGEHNDGIVRTPYLRQMFGNRIYDMFAQTKKIFDPHNIFNPGKKVGDTIQYEIDHIDLSPKIE